MVVRVSDRSSLTAVPGHVGNGAKVEPPGDLWQVDAVDGGADLDVAVVQLFDEQPAALHVQPCSGAADVDRLGAPGVEERPHVRRDGNGQFGVVVTDEYVLGPRGAFGREGVHPWPRRELVRQPAGTRAYRERARVGM